MTYAQSRSTETLHTVALKMVDTLDTMGFLPEITNTLRQTIREPMESFNDEEEGGRKLRLQRGGSWNYFPGGCRSAFRDLIEPDDANLNAGFRVCCLS